MGNARCFLVRGFKDMFANINKSSKKTLDKIFETEYNCHIKRGGTKFKS